MFKNGISYVCICDNLAIMANPNKIPTLHYTTQNKRSIS